MLRSKKSQYPSSKKQIQGAIEKWKEVVSPKGLKPKKHKEKRQARKPMGKERRKRKKAQIRRLENYQRKKKAKLGSPEVAKRLGIPKACSTAKKGLRHLKGKVKRTQETEDRYVLLRYQRSSKEKRRKPGVTSHGASGRYLGESEWRAIKRGVVARNFRTDKVGFRPFEKKDKEEGRPKAEPWGTWH